MKKIVSVLLSVIMIIITVSMVSAKERFPIQKSKINKVVTEKPVDLSTLKGKQIQLKKSKTINQSIGKQLKILPYKTNFHRIESKQFTKIQKNLELQSIKQNTYSGVKLTNDNTYKVFTKKGKIEKEGGIYPIYPISLGTGQILQAQMDVPKNDEIEYDLYLFKFGSDGKLISDPIDVSAYTGSLLSESIGTVNTDEKTNSYAIIVSSRKGSSDTDEFTVNISLGIKHDSFECNENAFDATTFPDITAGNEFNATGLTLNSPIDEDWFVMKVPNTDDFNSVEIKPNFSEGTNASNLQMEMYTVENGTQLKKNSSTKNGFIINKGYNYFRVHSGDAEFSPINYTFKVVPIYNASTVILNPFSDEKPCSTVTYEYGKLYYIKSASTFGMQTQLLSKNGYGVKGHTIEVSWEDPAWGPDSLPSCQRGSKVGITDLTGKVTVKNKMPSAYGQLKETGYPSYVIHYVDVITVQVYDSTMKKQLSNSNFYLSS